MDLRSEKIHVKVYEHISELELTLDYKRAMIDTAKQYLNKIMIKGLNPNMINSMNEQAQLAFEAIVKIQELENK